MAKIWHKKKKKVSFNLPSTHFFCLIPGTRKPYFGYPFHRQIIRAQLYNLDTIFRYVCNDIGAGYDFS